MKDDIQVHELKRALARCMGERIHLLQLVERMANPEPGDTFRNLRKAARELLAA